MTAQIEFSERSLQRFLLAEKQGTRPSIDREVVIAHAFLSGLVHHWPSKATAELRSLLQQCERIKLTEQSRWAVQRRIAIAKLAKVL